MTTDTLLIERREELKRRLAAGEFKTLVDIFLEWFERLLRKITRRTKPLPLWYITIALILVVVLMGLTSAFVTNGVGNVLKFLELNSMAFGPTLLYIISVVILPIASTSVIKNYIDRVLVFCRDEILGMTESTSSLDKIESWLNLLCNRWLNFLVVVAGGTLGGLYLLSQAPPLSSGYSFTFFTILINLFNWNIIYLLIMVMLLSATLRAYDLKLFASDPASSELITRLSEVLSFAVYFVAVFATLLTFTLTLVGILPSFGGSLIIFYWLPLFVLFILNQTSLASIVRRAKWKTLNEIQSQVEELRVSGSLKDKEIMEAINRLMDFHDRVKATRNSAIDSSTILNFINSLLLPLIAFILGNLDKVLLLFSTKP